MTRQEITLKAINLARQFDILGLGLATGVGKSKISLDIARMHIKNNEKILIVVAELAHKDNWKKEFTKWGYRTMYNKNATLVTYASLKNHINKHYNIIILDEAHHIDTELRQKVLSKITFDKLLLLSATLPESLIFDIHQSTKKSYTTFNISLQEAIEWGILKEPSINLIPLHLDNKHSTETITIQWGKKSIARTYYIKYAERWEYMKNRKKYPNTKLVISCTQREKYAYLNQQINYYKKTYFNSADPTHKSIWMRYSLERKRYLGELKTTIAYNFIQKNLLNTRHICFCASIDQADVLNKHNSIHSKKKNSLEIINKFNNRKINSLYAVGMLTEGQNLEDIEAGVIIQLDGGERTFIQKFGRSLRADNPVQYIFYFNQTRDHEYLINNVLNTIDDKYIKTIKL